MNIGKTKKVIKRPDVIPVVLPAPKPQPITPGIPAPAWPVRKDDPAIKPTTPTKGV